MSTGRTLDLGRTGICRLFSEYYFPTLLSMSFSALLNVTDGIFVGRGVGSDALAAVNVAAPVFMLSTGIGLMLGSGISVVGAIYKSRNAQHKSDVCMTLGLSSTAIAGLAIALLVLTLPSQLCYLFGGSDALLPYVKEYLTSLWLAMLTYGLMVAGMFAIRLDGSPRYAMMSNIIPAILNIVLDYVFIFPLDMGIGGAGIATSISGLVGAIIVILYFTVFSRGMRFRPIGKRMFKSGEAWLETRKMCKVGIPAFIGETAISFMLVVGNYMFISKLGEDGVAAYSVACYLMPMVFMFGNSVTQSAMPIVSFNYGCGQGERVRRTFNLSIIVGVATGILVSVAVYLLSAHLSACFLLENSAAYGIAVRGLPLFSLGFLPFTLNIILIGYFQSIEENRRASVFMFLRGYAGLLLLALVIPNLFGENGLWLTVPASECLTLLLILITWKRRGKHI